MHANIAAIARYLVSDGSVANSKAVRPTAIIIPNPMQLAA